MDTAVETSLYACVERKITTIILVFV